MNTSAKTCTINLASPLLNSPPSLYYSPSPHVEDRIPSDRLLHGHRYLRLGLVVSLRMGKEALVSKSKVMYMSSLSGAVARSFTSLRLVIRHILFITATLTKDLISLPMYSGTGGALDDGDDDDDDDEDDDDFAAEGAAAADDDSPDTDGRFSIFAKFSLALVKAAAAEEMISPVFNASSCCM